MTFRNVLILDGYIDEPSSLGVPPFLSPQVRYCYGSAKTGFKEAGISGTIKYVTIQQVRDTWGKQRKMHFQLSPTKKSKGRRKRDYLGQANLEDSKDLDSSRVLVPIPTDISFPDDLIGEADILVMINNTPVPGNYLRGRPSSRRELTSIASSASRQGIPVLSWKTSVENAIKLEKDPDAFLYDLIIGEEPRVRLRTIEEWDAWSLAGAEIISQHPDHSHMLISEIDTLKGCVRYINGGCVFCTDPLEHFRMRSVDSVLREVDALVGHGGRNIRLAGSCILSFQADGIGETDRPKPNPLKLERLFKGIRKRLPSDGSSGVFHTDNANAGIIAAHPNESREVLKSLVKYATPGNSLSLGLESADPVVVEKSHLNATPDEVRFAVEMINEVGGKKSIGGEIRTKGNGFDDKGNGMPYLLPGLNFLYGLPGEREETHQYNIEFLRSLRKNGNLLRRINVRQLSPVRIKGEGRNRSFHAWKEQIRKEIDVPNLRDIIPENTVLRDVHIEIHDGGISFGRQIGTYPILVGIPYPIPIGEVRNVFITGHGPRSVTGVEYPFPINHASLRALSSIPGVGRKRAASIIRYRPFSDPGQLSSIIEDEQVARSIMKLSIFN